MSTHPRPTRIPRGAAAALAVTAAMIAVAGTAGAAHAAPGQQVDPFAPDFGPNVEVVSPDTPLDEVQAMLDDLAAAQVDAEMSTARHSVLFLPGAYGTAADPLQARVGYYTEIAGLGASPEDVDITGKLEVYNRCLADGGTSNCLALVNFWRTISNLSLHVNGAGQDGCRAERELLGRVAGRVDAPPRRVGRQPLAHGLLHRGPAVRERRLHRRLAPAVRDQRIAAAVAHAQQRSWPAGRTRVWNQVFSGVEGAPDDAAFPNPPYTTLDETPVSREKPYLFVDADGRYAVRVPEAQTDSRGITWADGETPGRTIPITDFYIAKPGDSVEHDQLRAREGQAPAAHAGRVRRRQHHQRQARRHGRARHGPRDAHRRRRCGAAEVADAPGIVVAGVTIDAGTVESPVLLQVGSPGNGQAKKVDPANPITLSDVYFRVGGPHIGKADTALVVNSDHVLIDHTWVWRGDHGVEGFTNGVNGDTDRWNTNTGRTGVVVNGDDVTATGLFVEHFQQFNTVWNGERGTTVLYQNELPYDPPTQADWTQPDGTLGYPGYKVADDVTRAHALRRRRLRVQPEQPVDRHRERVRGARG